MFVLLHTIDLQEFIHLELDALVVLRIQVNIEQQQSSVRI